MSSGEPSGVPSGEAFVLDLLPPAELEAELGHCCGARRFVGGLAARRPYGSADGLFAAAAEVEAGLAAEDWLEAFAHHPRIGDREALRLRFASGVSKSWSRGEQGGVEGAEEAVLERLAAGNDAYEQRFGYLFIVCATGKSAGEMLALLEARLGNDPGEEIAIAAREQSKITHLRLHKLLARLSVPPGTLLQRTS